MRILLVQPPHNEYALASGLLEPLSLEILAGTVPEHEVRILDMRVDSSLDSLLRTWRPRIVGITAISPEVKTALAAARRVKRLCPEAISVVGGHHATMSPVDFASPAVDWIAIGPGEESFPALVRAVENGEEPDGIPGLAAVRDGELHAPDDPAPVQHPDALPRPRRDLTAKYRKSYWMLHWRRVGLIATTRGCPFRCNFCACWKLANGRYHVREPENVVDELAGIKERYIYFADDNTFLNPRKAEELYELIRRAGIKKKYFGYIRADTIARNPGLIAKWREIGLDSLVVGLETYRDEDLRDYRKQGQVESNEAAIRILQENNIRNYAHYIVRPEFTREDFDELYDYVESRGLVFPVFPMYTPLPGTDLFREKRQELATDNYDLFDLGHMVMKTRLPLRQFYEEVLRLHRRVFSFRRYLKALAASIGAWLGAGRGAADARRRRLPLPVLLWINLKVIRNPRFRKKYLSSLDQYTLSSKARGSRSPVRTGMPAEAKNVEAAVPLTGGHSHLSP